jgi:hypothetical protein
MSPEDDNGGWGARDTPPKDVLRVYNPAPGSWEALNAANTPDFNHDGCLFVRDLSPGQNLIYRAEDAARMLAGPTYSETLKRRISEAIPRLTAEQKKALAQHITPEGLAIIRGYEPANADMISVLNEGGRHTATAADSSRTIVQTR